MTRSAVIVGGNRTPFVKAGTAYAAASNSDLLTAALDGLVARFGLAGKRVDEVAGGAVLKHSRDFNLTREAVLGSALDPLTPAVDLQQACATGLETVIYLANKITLGQADVGIGEVLATIDKNGLSERTLVIFCSDNGPFLSYGNHAGSSGPLREGKLTTFEGGVRTPCIMRWPNKIPAGRVSNDLFSTLDLLPTFAKLAGGKLSNNKIDGEDRWRWSVRPSFAPDAYQRLLGRAAVSTPANEEAAGAAEAAAAE